MNYRQRRWMGIVFILILSFTTSIMAKDYYVISLKDEPDKEFEIKSIDKPDSNTVIITASVTHKKGILSGSQAYQDKFIPPAELIDEGYKLVKREIASFEGKGAIYWEDLQINGYACVVYLIKKWYSSASVTYTAKFYMYKDYELPAPPAAPALIKPIYGKQEFSMYGTTVFEWDACCENSRFVIIDKDTGKYVFKRQTLGKYMGVPNVVFKTMGNYKWGVSVATNNLKFSEYTFKDFRTTYEIETQNQVCPTCNGMGHVWQTVRCRVCAGSGQVPDGNGGYKPCARCRGTGTVSEYRICNNCHGTGRITVYIKRYFLIFY